MNGRLKVDGLKEAVSNPALCERIGAAWRLFLLLLLFENGVLCGQHQQIAEKLNANERTFRNWLKTLESAEVAERINHGKSIEVRLKEPFFGYSRLPDRNPPQTASNIQESPKLRLLRTIQAGAEEIGATIEVKIAV